MSKFKEELKKLKPLNFLLLTLSGTINAIGIVFFLAPVNLFDSGFSGTAMFFNEITGIPLAVFLLVLNIPFFIFGYKRQGTVFTIYSIYAVLIYSLASFVITNILPIDVSSSSPFAGTDLLLCAIFGGLISGVAYTIKQLNPKIKVYGVQAAGAPSMVNSIRDGKIERLDNVSTIADGIKVKEPGQHTFDICSKYVDEIVTVTDDEIAAAILALIEQQKLIAEGAGAVSVAAVMFDKVPVKGKKVVCLVSGGNIDVTILSRVIHRGLVKSGRTALLNIELLDKPGQLLGVSRIIAQLGGNVVGVHHEHVGNSDINGCYLRIEMETRNFEHLNEIRKALTEAGFKIVD